MSLGISSGKGIRETIPMNTPPNTRKSVLITGAGGYIGRQVVEALVNDRRGLETIVAMDIRLPGSEQQLPGVEYIAEDVRSRTLGATIRSHGANIVAHLAAMVTPGRDSDRDLEYSVDVLGAENVLKSCLEAGVTKLIYTSSGAAYGYHADNPEWLDETDQLRGNPEFAYSDHKRLVEEMLAAWKVDHPELEQLIFRPGTILGSRTSNQITALFDKPVVWGIMGSTSPFVIIWDQDVAACIVKGIHEDVTGIYNLAGDGVLTMREIARLLNKLYVPLPAGLVKATLWVLKQLRMTRYGPEQVNFLRYRPVLSNQRLKKEFGYVPRMTTREVFEYFLDARQSGS